MEAMKQKFKKEQERDTSLPHEGDSIEHKVEMQSSHSTWIDKENTKKIIDQSIRGLKSTYKYCLDFLRNQKIFIRHYLIVLTAVLFTIILVQNIASSQVELLFWGFNAPRSIIFMIMLIIGFGAGYWLGSKRNRHFDQDILKGGLR